MPQLNAVLPIRGYVPSMRDVKDQLDAELRDTSRRLAFWREQEKLQAGTELVEHIRKIAAGYDVQLAQLRAARRLFDA